MKKKPATTAPILCAHTDVVPIADLKPHPRNPNTHPFKQIKMLAAIIKAQGWRVPITVSIESGFVVRGHGRLLAAQEAGFKTVPIDSQHYDTEASEIADLVADNQIAELAEMDVEKLYEIVETTGGDLVNFGFDVAGFDDLLVEVNAITGGDGGLDSIFGGDDFFDDKPKATQRKICPWCRVDIATGKKI